MLVQTLHTTQFRSCIEALKPFLLTRSSSSTSSHHKPRGRPRIAPRWLLVALAVLKHSSDITGRQHAGALQHPELAVVLREFGATRPPAKSTLHKAWEQALIGQLRHTLIELGWNIANNPKALAIDSSGFEVKAGSTWRLVKWQRSALTKTSTWFHKAHILVDTATQAVLSLSLTKSVVHDVTQIHTLLRQGYLLGRKRRLVLFGDKAYHHKQLHAKLLDWGVKVIVEPKTNFRLGQRQGLLERTLHLYQRSPGLWKYILLYHEKTTVDHVFGLVKIHKPSLQAQTLKNKHKHKHLLTAFLLANLNLLPNTLTMEVHNLWTSLIYILAK